jgi:G3E family GTPase
MPEAVAFADRIVITKTDMLRDPASHHDLEELRAQLSAINPVATVVSLPLRLKGPTCWMVRRIGAFFLRDR